MRPNFIRANAIGLAFGLAFGGTALVISASVAPVYAAILSAVLFLFGLAVTRSLAGGEA